MILNMSGGGGTSLNFKVVGNPQPNNPSNNTIWLNTDVPITRWLLSPTEPSSSESGMAWITIGSSGPVSFNALKKNGIQICPISAKQYINGAWVDKTAKSWQDGKWVDWIVYLFNNGDNETVSGGWSAVASSYNGLSGGTPTLTVKGDSLVCDNNNGSIGYLKHNNPVDLTPYNTVHISGTFEHISGQATYSRPIIMPKTGGDWYKDKLKDVGAPAFGDFEDFQIDVETIDEEALICWGFYYQTGTNSKYKVTIRNIWFTS